MVDEIVVMMAPGHLDAVRAIVRNGGYDKVTQVLEGGDTRNGTTAARARRARRATTARCSSTTRCGRWSAQRIITECFEALRAATTRSTWRSRPPTRSSRSTSDNIDPDDPRPRRTCAAARPRRRSARRCIRAAYDLAGAGPRLRRHRRLRRRAALPARRADLGRRRRGAEHEGDRPDRRLPGRQALPADQQRRRPASAPPRQYRASARRQGRSSSSAAATASAPTSPRWPASYGATGLRVQPLQHQHPRRAARATSMAALDAGARREPGGSTTSSTPPASCRAARCSRPARRRSTPPPRSTTSRRCSSPRRSSRTCSRPQGQLLLFTPAPTPAAAAATASTPRPRPPW